ncbi:sugar kinase [Leptolyngbya sp. FACHB-36]|uniref:sugar kinase n=1 Tax=Leptolyngbya sp. FACHB-36 TaxID=2692808 RepID=UPI00167FECBE|nr:sugar kinase [Leptolyngbya sp. FACHB-36]MBD2021545.1 sugar kinase [Leptolyngbya sp. FACHB-36]
MSHGLFVGLTTLDLVYRVAGPPIANQKLVASDYTVSAGGPATNAAVAFRQLGDRATVLSVVGSHAITHLIRADLQTCGVELADLAPTRSEPPPVSSILVTEATGDRAVVSVNAVKSQVDPAAIPPDCLQDVAIVLIDGHQMAAGRAIAERAKEQGIPVAIDGGSWKPGFETLLPLVDYAICSANFQPPGCQSEDVLPYLAHLGIPHIAITQGDQPIQYRTMNQQGRLDVPTVQTVDTLGAGDIFHGAFCHAILQQEFVEALTIASQVAAESCRFFGTRRWIQERSSDLTVDSQ